MNNTREALMRKIQEYAFVAHECVLYLDCHPNNRRALQKHQEAVKALNEAVERYEGMYGPLTANSVNANQNGGWSWVYGKWPWQNYEDGKER